MSRKAGHDSSLWGAGGKAEQRRPTGNRPQRETDWNWQDFSENTPQNWPRTPHGGFWLRHFFVCGQEGNVRTGAIKECVWLAVPRGRLLIGAATPSVQGLGSVQASFQMLHPIVITIKSTHLSGIFPRVYDLWSWKKSPKTAPVRTDHLGPVCPSSWGRSMVPGPPMLCPPPVPA